MRRGTVTRRERRSGGMTAPSGIITFTSDFAAADGYAGAVKGVILEVFPGARIVDIAHDIPPGDIEAGAWCLFNATGYFPGGTIHLAVVDPGVGSGRRPLVVDAGEDRIFVGPDNGLFDFVLGGGPPRAAWEIDETSGFFGEAVSGTFHGRDVFGPAAALLAGGTRPGSFARKADPSTLVRLGLDFGYEVSAGEIRGRVLSIDRFGNVVTSIPGSFGAGITAGRLGKRAVKKTVACYNDIPGSGIAFIEGSAGFMEISAKGRSAAGLAGARRGDRVRAFTGASRPRK